MSRQSKLVAWSAYPTVMILVLILHERMLAHAWGLQIATYIPITLGILSITLLEKAYPHCSAWLANRADVLNDAAFMILVQILLPRFLSFFAVLTFVTLSQPYTSTFHAWWPHDWPVAAQALLMLLTADFFRYWLHRASHQWSPLLWRFHAVHHAPQKLYWINVGRFHPIEKSIQYIFDALPFILLGVSEEVLALYFVFYATNGFFQHCNIELRLGFLNYIISGPELHRWHHSKEPEESNHNYGNNLIIWDVIFGTRFLPEDRLTGPLGLINRNYPQGFVAQMRSPFIKGLDQG